jgi:hypothetical protein
VRQHEYEYTRHEQAHAKCSADIERGLRTLLKSEGLIAYGRRESPIAEHQVIPASAWDALRIKRFKSSLLSERNKNRTEIFDVRTFPTLESEAALQHLQGKTIVEAFERFVFGSPDIIQKQRRSVANGGRPLALDTEHSLFQAIWPVRVESWFASARADLCADVHERARSAGADRFLSRRFGRLVDYLARGEIVAEGLSASGGLCRIPCEEWYGAGRLLDLAKGNLLESVPHDREPYRILFSGLRLVMPGEDIRMFHVKPPTSAELPPSTMEPINVAPQSNAGGRRTMRDQCVEWLMELMLGSPNERKDSIAALFGTAKAKWPTLSQRGFRAARDEAIRRTGADAWGKAGAPKKSKGPRQ